MSAHCVGVTDAANVSLITDEHPLSLDFAGDQRQLRSVKQLFIQPQYNVSIDMGDIAVLHVYTSFTLTKYV
jgi:hypothetical protein